MAKQGERYNPKTKTGWKFENLMQKFSQQSSGKNAVEIVVKKY